MRALRFLICLLYRGTLNTDLYFSINSELLIYQFVLNTNGWTVVIITYYYDYQFYILDQNYKVQPMERQKQNYHTQRS